MTAAADDPPRGPLFISFEGVDGSGKSTQARSLAVHLRARGADVTLTREPGGSPGAEEIRALVLNGDAGRWSPETEILLFTAARRDHLERTIRPALARGGIVICDRFADSTRMYQGATRGDLRAMVDALHALMIGVEPDLTFIVDMDPARALARGLARPGAEQRFENMGLAVQEAVRAGYLALARAEPRRCEVVEGDRAEADVAADIARRALRRLAR
ncbi:MAG: dTMP kinase [Rubellimicrobium sp.]|nr:dTMP kinase [Rubellimicrobium sp.]